MTKTVNPRYCPADWLDEVNPLGATPEDFVRRRDGDRWIMVDPDEDYGSEEYYKGDIELGQIVKFARLTTYDDITLTVREDGTYAADVPAFDGNPSFRLPDWEWEDMVDDLKELIAIGTRGTREDKPLEPGDYIVECWSWHDGDTYRFEPDGETPKFVLCAGAN